VARAGVSVEGLVRAAAELADEVGFEQVTVSALARRFDVTVASLYSHIKNLDELRVRVAALALTELADRASAALAGRAGREALVAFGGVYRQYAKEHPGRYTAARLRIERDSPAAAQALRHTELMRAILREYKLPENEQVHAVRLLGSTFHGFASLETSGAFAHSPDVDGSWARALDALHVALLNWPRPLTPQK
jgi:AcrR family transcriptional regulator